MAQKRKASISQRVQEVFKKVQRRRSPRTKPSESSIADEHSPSPALSNIERFKAVFPQILDDVQSACEKYSLDIEVWQSLEKSLNHNATGGKYNRGLSVLDTAQMLLSRDLNDDEFSDLALLGWMIELFQAFMLVHDDIMDGSSTRRGRPCWYKLPEVGLTSVNDGVLLESIIFLLLKKHFRTHANYVGLIELFQETAFRTELGQASDMLVAPETARWGEDGQRLDLARYNSKRYSTIVKFKTSYYSFYTPIVLALLYTGKASAGNLSKTEDITLALGEYFQIQDDYLDCFGDPVVLGKIGMDIQDNKCSWLVCQALMRCSVAQRKVLDLNYGIHNSDAEAAVKKLYADLQLAQVYHEYEDVAVARIQKSITALDERDGLRKTVFDEFLRKIHRRDK